MLPAKENPSLGRLELRLLFFASLISPPFLRIPFLREPRKSVKGLFRALPGARGESRRTSTRAISKSGRGGEQKANAMRNVKAVCLNAAQHCEGWSTVGTRLEGGNTVH